MFEKEGRLAESTHDLQVGQTGAIVSLFDFKPEKPLELALAKGEAVHVLNDENPEWLWVENDEGKQGYVPRSFLSTRGY